MEARMDTWKHDLSPVEKLFPKIYLLLILRSELWGRWWWEWWKSLSLLHHLTMDIISECQHFLFNLSIPGLIIVLTLYRSSPHGGNMVMLLSRGVVTKKSTVKEKLKSNFKHSSDEWKGAVSLTLARCVSSLSLQKWTSLVWAWAEEGEGGDALIRCRQPVCITRPLHLTSHSDIWEGIQTKMTPGKSEYMNLKLLKF